MMEIKFSDKKIIAKSKTTVALTEADVENIMVSAIEGGIGYWACLGNGKPEFEDKPKDEPLSTWCAKLLIDGKQVVFTDVEEEEDEEWVLTLDKLLEGVKLNKIHRKFDSDLENGDATTADCIIQFALFGEVVYG